jgi:hypothetical protein
MMKRILNQAAIDRKLAAIDDVIDTTTISTRNQLWARNKSTLGRDRKIFVRRSFYCEIQSVD